MDTSTKTVMLVDDSPTMRKMIRAALHKYHDFQFIEADDGIDALEKIKQHPIRLIFLDFNMPRMNGIQFMQVLRKDKDHQRTPIIMITTETEKAKVTQSYVAGATVFMNKPVNESELTRVVDAMRYWHMK